MIRECFLKIGVLAAFILALFMPCGETLGNEPIERRYIEDNGDVQKEVAWRLLQSIGYSLTYETDEEVHITRMDESYDTLSWTMDKPFENSAIFARRQENTIIIDGLFHGRRLQKSIEVDDAPWFQATSLSLSKFAVSTEKEIEFWTIRPDTLKAYKLKAIREANETFLVGEKPVKAVKLKLVLSGLLSPFFTSSYWFSEDDGMFLGFVGQADPLGMTRISVTYSRK